MQFFSLFRSFHVQVITYFTKPTVQRSKLKSDNYEPNKMQDYLISGVTPVRCVGVLHE